MRSIWRFLDTGQRTAAENMALDDVILECRADGLIPDTVRLLRFKPPAVLVGYHQDVEHEVRLNFVRKAGIDVNRRLTGGGAIYFDESSLGWEVIASKSAMPHHTIDDLFHRLCKVAVTALQALGVEASFRPRNDVEVGGRKISGTGGVERGKAFLFQGTLLVDFDVETMIKALRIPLVKLKDKELESAKRRVTCLRWELGYVPSYWEVKKAFKEAFEEVLGVELVEGGLTEAEERMLAARLPYFCSDEWIHLDRRSPDESALVHAVDKTPGGVIRVSLALDKCSRIIKSALITGDFFAFPQRAIMDLEAALKFVSYDGGAERVVRRFFEERRIRIPGVEPEDIIRLITEAVDRAHCDIHGLSAEEANHLYPVLGRLRELPRSRFDYLLLPYCAKLPSCEYRYREGCARCGACSVGEAYNLAEEVGLTPITIQNFEHLMETLRRLRKRGARGYIGCCCEAFYYKHKDDLERAGVSSIIIDIEDATCYDLGRAEEALRGEFEAQTKLRLDLLRKVMHCATESDAGRVISLGSTLWWSSISEKTSPRTPSHDASARG
jgi:lipoate-protein ligase A